MDLTFDYMEDFKVITSVCNLLRLFAFSVIYTCKYRYIKIFVTEAINKIT